MKRIASILAALLIGFGPVAHALTHAGNGDHGCQTCQVIRSPLTGASVALAVRVHVLVDILVLGKSLAALAPIVDSSRSRAPPL